MLLLLLAVLPDEPILGFKFDRQPMAASPAAHYSRGDEGP
jgi:hypothetical protein